MLKPLAHYANRAKSEFLANMSHELRTPLNAILGFTQVMSRDTSLSSEYQQYLDIISRSSEHLLSLINNILEMSKIEAGRLAVNETSFNLRHLLDTLEKLLRLKAESKGLQLIFDIASDLPDWVRGDDSKLRSCLINLLGNAIKFTSEGSVTLRGRLGQQCPIPYVQLVFEVEDTGPGIDPEDIDIVFEPFGQTEIGRNAQGGTGLGLPISRQYVQMMGGEISVSCKLGKGSIFTFNIQVALGEATEIESDRPDEAPIVLAPNQKQYGILVVEDRLENRLLLVKQLTTIGFGVREAINGREAVELWENWKPHPIWMNLRTPEMEGYEATRQIRARESRWRARNSRDAAQTRLQTRNGELTTSEAQSAIPDSRTVIIALTANAFEEDRDRALEAGCDDFMRKPFQEKEIFEKMAQHLGVRYVCEVSSHPGVCGSEEPKNQAESDSLGADSLAAMPAEWLALLHAAALSAREKDLWRLIEQIPEKQAALARVLSQHVKNFRLDLIIDITSNV